MRLGAALRGGKGEVNPAALFFGENMTVEAWFRLLGEKPYSMPKYDNPKELAYAVNELINDSDAIDDPEARVLRAENNRRLAAIIAEINFEEISPEAVA